MIALLLVTVVALVPAVLVAYARGFSRRQTRAVDRIVRAEAHRGLAELEAWLSVQPPRHPVDGD